MKAAAFDLVQPRTLEAALDALGGDGSRPAAGYQSLGPMLNLRLAQPVRLVDLNRVPELRAVSEEDGAIILGACITHAEIEDGAVADGSAGALPAVAAGIAYRAVRNRGTIGGSLAHADPAADWPTALAAAGAAVRVAGSSGVRRIPVDSFIRGAFDSALDDGEIVAAVEIPRFSSGARWGFWKFCRKAGEFAEAMCAVLVDRERSVCRIALGATDSKPLVADLEPDALDDTAALDRIVEEGGLGGDAIHARLHRAAMRRAVAQATGRASA